MNLKQLSQHLNLSQTTVSRALNGYPEVSEATRKRVQDAAKSLHYSPNARAKGLATGRAQAIGHILPVKTRLELVNPIFGDFIAGASETYAAAGYEVLLSLVEEGAEDTLYRALHARGSVDGIIVHAPKMTDTRIPLLQDLGIPFLVHGRASDVLMPYSWLDTDNLRAFRKATEFLHDMGHRRIALINGTETQDFAHRRREGYITALQAHGVPADPALMRSDEMTESYGFRSASEMLGSPAPPTAFLVASMVIAIGVRRAIEARGLKMGRDISVVTHDDDLSYLQNGEDEPIFTATRSSVRHAGMRAAAMLLTLIREPEVGPLTELMAADLVVGASTGPVPST